MPYQRYWGNRLGYPFLKAGNIGETSQHNRTAGCDAHHNNTQVIAEIPPRFGHAFRSAQIEVAMECTKNAVHCVDAVSALLYVRAITLGVNSGRLCRNTPPWSEHADHVTGSQHRKKEPLE
jgi:hypothetical protein